MLVRYTTRQSAVRAARRVYGQEWAKHVRGARTVNLPPEYGARARSRQKANATRSGGELVYYESRGRSELLTQVESKRRSRLSEAGLSVNRVRKLMVTSYPAARGVVANSLQWGEMVKRAVEASESRGLSRIDFERFDVVATVGNDAMTTAFGYPGKFNGRIRSGWPSRIYEFILEQQLKTLEEMGIPGTAFILRPAATGSGSRISMEVIDHGHTVIKPDADFSDFEDDTPVPGEQSVPLWVSLQVKRRF